MKIFITGPGGFLGQELVKRLHNEGHELFGIYEHPDSLKKNPAIIKKRVINLMDFSEIENYIKLVQPDIVIHLAAKTEVALSFDNYKEVSQVNYVGTVNLAEANRRFNPNLKLFIMASTMETYGWHDKKDGAFNEDTKQRPRAPYAVAKLACEAYLRYMFFAYNFPFVAFRQTNAYGRHDNDFFVTEHIISQMLTNPDVCRLGAAEPWRNFLYVDDLMDLYIAAINAPDKVKGEFLVTGPNNAIPIHKLADMIKSKLNWKGEIQWNTKPERPGEIFYLNSDPAKAKKLLGWEPKIDLDKGLSLTIEKWKANYAGQTKQIRKK